MRSYFVAAACYRIGQPMFITNFTVKIEGSIGCEDDIRALEKTLEKYKEREGMPVDQIAIINWKELEK